MRATSPKWSEQLGRAASDLDIFPGIQMEWRMTNAIKFR
jgi:hypothetical protein